MPKRWGQNAIFAVALVGVGCKAEVTTPEAVDPNPAEKCRALVSTEVADFGDVPFGSSRSHGFVITNPCSESIDVRLVLGSNTTLCEASDADQVAFCVRNASGTLGQGGPHTIGPGADLVVGVRFTPVLTGSPEMGQLVVRTCADDRDERCHSNIRLQGAGSGDALRCTTDIDFGIGNPGTTVVRPVVCTNFSGGPIAIERWFVAPGSDPSFGFDNPEDIAPIVEGRGEVRIDLRFSPTDDEPGLPVNGAVVIESRALGASVAVSRANIALHGTPGGADIEVVPTSLDFGQIAVGTTHRRRVQVRNDGFETLTLTVRETATPFSADRNALVVTPGDIGSFEVVFAPELEGRFNGQILLVTNDPDEPEVAIGLTGDSVALGSCRYRLAPQMLNFGIVEVLHTASQRFTIENTGTSECLVNDFALSRDSSPSFALVDGPRTGLRIPPGEIATIAVSFTPQVSGSLAADIPFYISDPANSNPVLELRGVGSASVLLVSPDVIDFGQVGIECSTRDRSVTIQNPGSAPAVIDRIEGPSGAASDFVVADVPVGLANGQGVVLPPGGSVELTLQYGTSDFGADRAFLRIFERGQAEPYVVPLYGEGAVNPINEDTMTQVATSAVDILFVVDNSCSMSDEQASLTSNFRSFIRFADEQALGYQIAVVSTDVEAGFGGGCTSTPNPQRPPLGPNGVSQGACGYFADGDGAGASQNEAWRMVTPDEQPSAAEAFAAIVAQGTAGSGSERGLEAAYRALSSPLITGWNAGFLRPDAYLAVIVVSDEQDQSPLNVDFYVNYLRSIKGIRNTNLFSLSAIVVPPHGCGVAHDGGSRYIEAANRTGGVVESICTPDWGQALENLGHTSFGYRSRFLLSNTPVEGTLAVQVDGVESEAAGHWRYDSTHDSIDFLALAIPEPGATIVARYQIGCR